MDIVFSANNRKEVLVLPIVPSDLSWDSPSNNETFDSIQLGTLNIAGLEGLISLSIQSFFPMKDYPFVKSKKKGAECVNFFKKWKKRREPIRIVITSKNKKEWLNISVLIDNFTHGLDKAGDISYSLDLTEFRPVKVV
jgi:hypothetical protein